MPYEISYNGILLEVLRVWDYKREPVFNGPDYLYTRHQLFVRCLFNPAAVAYTKRGNAPGVFPVRARGLNVGGAETDDAIKHFLSQPRKTLLWTIPDLRTAADRILLLSPSLNPANKASYPCDAANGPFPRVLGVVAIKGTKSFLVDWAIETFVNECDLYLGGSESGGRAGSIILSNRWQMAEDLDQDFFTTRTIRGRAVFRADRLLAMGSRADDFRNYFASFPLPRAYHRVRVSVVVSEDGTACDYVIIDRELPIRVRAKGITRIEFVSSKAFSWAGGEKTIFGGSFKDYDKVIESISRVPSLDRKCRIRVWGHAFTTRQQILRALELGVTLWLAEARQVGLMASGNMLAYGRHMNVTIDHTGKYGEAEIAVLGGISATFGESADARKKALDFRTFLRDGVLNQNQWVDAAGFLPSRGADDKEFLMMEKKHLPVPPHSKGTRGYLIEGLVTAALLRNCEVPENVSENEDLLNEYMNASDPAATSGGLIRNKTKQHRGGQNTQDQDDPYPRI